LGYNEQNRPDNLSAIFVTVPGAPAGWVDTHEKFGSGKFTLLELLQPAIDHAEAGWVVEPVTAHNWKTSEERIKNASPNGGEMLLNGAAPQAGEIMKMPTLAASMRELGTYGKKGFYEGRIAQAIVDVIGLQGGFMSMEDLAEHVSTEDTPIHVNYRGVDVYEMPPNGQGITALAALNILEGFSLSGLEHNSAPHLHLVIESLRLAFADAHFYVTDPAFENVPVAGMISKDYARERRALISVDRANPDIEHGFPPNIANTVYFCVVDGEGNACSFINSNYQGFGTCIIPKDCGFTLQNRGANFSLDPASANRLAPGKRPYHTIIPGMALKYGQLFCPFGVMGGFMQPQGHLQVISNMVDFRMDPQQALDAPRVQVDGGTAAGEIQLEDGITEEVRQTLQNMGHKNPRIVKGWERQNFGVGQIITRNPDNGVLCAGSDGRNDGFAIGY
jgi:gamma-glutamyltranspeptidase/glutathione hydrolase